MRQDVFSFVDAAIGVQIFVDKFNYTVSFKALKPIGLFLDMYDGREHLWTVRGLSIDGENLDYMKWYSVEDKEGSLNKYIGNLATKTGNLFSGMI